jgi:hypothetical protein
MKAFTLFSCLFILVLFSSCRKDIDPDPESVIEICDTLVCQNGGTCESGVCACPTGYGGYDCSQEVLADWIELDCVEVFHFIETNNGHAWDEGESGIDTLPDLKIEVAQGFGVPTMTGEWFYNGATAAFNVTNDQTYVFERNNAIVFPLNQDGLGYESISITLRDMDAFSSSEEQISALIYQSLGSPYLSNLPSQIEFSNSDFGLRIFPKFHWN